MKSGIYRIYWENGFFYYGQSIKLKERWLKHISQFKNGNNSNKKIQELYNKYGLPFFEVVEYVDHSKLTEREQYYLDLYFKDDKCCNLSPTSGSILGFKMPDHHAENLRKRCLGVKMSDQARANMSAAGKLKVLSEEHKRKIGLKSWKGAEKGKEVFDSYTGIFYQSIKAASFSINKNESTLQRLMKKNQSRFMYINNN